MRRLLLLTASQACLPEPSHQRFCRHSRDLHRDPMRLAADSVLSGRLSLRQDRVHKDNQALVWPRRSPGPPLFDTNAQPLNNLSVRCPCHWHGCERHSIALPHPPSRQVPTSVAATESRLRDHPACTLHREYDRRWLTRGSAARA